MRAWLLLSVLLVPACASTPGIGAAERGDYPSLKQEIEARHRAGSLTEAQATKLAKAVAEHEVASAKGDDAIARVREVRACARELDDVLARRQDARDGAGAEAAWARVESGELSLGSVRALASDSDDGYRAVGTLALTRRDDAPQRRRAMTDGSPRVRRAAMRAALTAEDADDAATLLESARLDPEPIVRTDAVRALAHVPANAESANKLRDLWASADAPLREDIALAWASPSVYAAGGREALRVLIATKSGPAALSAATAVAHGRPGRDTELELSALALLARTIHSGPRRDRLHAIAGAPLAPSAKAPSPDAEVLSALRLAADDDDREVRIGALARLTEVATDKPSAVTRLEAIAANEGPEGAHARSALASAGDARVQAWLEADLAAESESARILAANGLASLHRAARAARLLVAPEASVRTRAACTILMAARSRATRHESR